MKVGIVSSSVFSEYKRMDADFLIALDCLEHRIKELQNIPKSKLISILKSLDIDNKMYLMQIARYKKISYFKRDVNSLIEQYPYLAYAIIEKNLQNIKNSIKANISHLQEQETILDEIEIIQKCVLT